MRLLRQLFTLCEDNQGYNCSCSYELLVYQFVWPGVRRLLKSIYTYQCWTHTGFPVSWVSQSQMTRGQWLRAHLWWSIPDLEPIKRQAVTSPLIANSRHAHSGTHQFLHGFVTEWLRPFVHSKRAQHPGTILHTGSSAPAHGQMNEHLNQTLKEKLRSKTKTDRMEERWNESGFQQNEGGWKAADLTQVGITYSLCYL